MTMLLMPKATAIWLIDHTALTFEQIGEFTGLHALEIQALADGEIAPGMHGLDPVQNGQLTQEEIRRCEQDANARLALAKRNMPEPEVRSKGPRYTPLARRAEKPDGIAWLVKHHPELNDSQITRLVGTTKTTITAIRNRSHWNFANLTPRSPVELGLCSQAELSREIQTALKAGRKPAEKAAGAHGTAAAGGESKAAGLANFGLSWPGL